LQIIEVLKRFQEGYTLRNVDIADSFVDELYSSEEEAYVLGTGTGELFLGKDRILELIKDDWNYWGDVSLYYENPYLSVNDDVALIVMQGSVKYSFEDTPERYDNYLNFIRKKMSDQELTSQQKITFLNWALMLTYHQRDDKKREYQWPLCLSGVMKKEGEKWKFTQQHFSISVADYPDERFENSKDHQEFFQKQNLIASVYRKNQITEQHKEFLKEFEQILFGNKNLTQEVINHFFPESDPSLLIGPDHNEYSGNEINQYFMDTIGSSLTLALDYAIATSVNDLTWITVTGTIEQDIKKDQQLEQLIQRINKITECDSTAKEKIFMVQRRIAYLLKEESSGGHSTYPLRMSFVLSDSKDKPAVQLLHISYPSYWIFEGKVDEISEQVH
jgi:hypothetical protein